MNQHQGHELMLPMRPTLDGEGWQLLAVDLAVDNGAVNGEVNEVLHSQVLGWNVLGLSIW